MRARITAGKHKPFLAAQIEITGTGADYFAGAEINKELVFRAILVDPVPRGAMGQHPIVIECLGRKDAPKWRYEHKKAEILVDCGDFSEIIDGRDIVIRALPVGGTYTLGSITFP